MKHQHGYRQSALIEVRGWTIEDRFHGSTAPDLRALRSDMIVTPTIAMIPPAIMKGVNSVARKSEEANIAITGAANVISTGGLERAI
jgi:hypothetical protein